MKNRDFKELVLVNFPELTVRRDVEHPQLFIMLNKKGEMFDEAMTSYSANKTWEIAYRLMLRGELKPDWKEESEKSSREIHEKLIEVQKDTSRKFITKNQVNKLINEVLDEFSE